MCKRACAKTTHARLINPGACGPHTPGAKGTKRAYFLRGALLFPIESSRTPGSRPSFPKESSSQTKFLYSGETKDDPPLLRCASLVPRTRSISGCNWSIHRHQFHHGTVQRLSVHPAVDRKCDVGDANIKGQLRRHICVDHASSVQVHQLVSDCSVDRGWKYLCYMYFHPGSGILVLLADFLYRAAGDIVCGAGDRNGHVCVHVQCGMDCLGHRHYRSPKVGRRCQHGNVV